MCPRHRVGEGCGEGRWHHFELLATVPVAPGQALADSIWTMSPLVDLFLGALGRHLVAKLLQNSAKMGQDRLPERPRDLENSAPVGARSYFLRSWLVAPKIFKESPRCFEM